jgi:hypothetical protein
MCVKKGMPVSRGPGQHDGPSEPDLRPARLGFRDEELWVPFRSAVPTRPPRAPERVPPRGRW